jgi:monoterpene epsilon-lactone hydrolase
MPSPEHNSVVAALRTMPSIGSGAEFDLAAARKSMEILSANPQIPDGTVFEKVNAGGVPSEWISGPESDPRKTVLYLHGGGYTLGSIDTHRGLGAWIAQACGARVLIIDYRLAPETPFPGAVEDAAAAYRFLLEQGVTPEHIAIGGDSAGGGLTLASLVHLKEEGLPLPGAAFALSPWVDLEGLGESMTTRAEADPMVDKQGLIRMGKLYLGDADPKTPLAAPLYADLSGLPPMLIQVGTAEVLLDDSTRVVERLQAAGVAVELEQFEDLIHVFQAFAPVVPESVEAIGKIGAFVKSHL